jgi:hypothetical protein
VPAAAPVAPPPQPSAAAPALDPFVAEQPTPAFALPSVEEIEATQSFVADVAAPVVDAPNVAAPDFNPTASERETPAFEAPLPVAPLRPTTPAQTFDITIPEPVAAEESTAETVAEQAAGPDHWSVAVTPAYTPAFQSVIDEVPPADDVMSSLDQQPAEDVASFEAPPPGSVDAPEPTVTRPVTSEMVAIDAFEAFETVWDATPEPEPAQPEQFEATLPDETAAASPLDGDSLGSGIDAQHLWGDEITQDTGDYQAYAPAAEPAADSSEDAPIEAGWASHTTPELPMPAWLADDTPGSSPEPFATSEPAVDDLPPAPHEATASSIVGSVPTGSTWSDPRVAAYAAFVTSPDGVPAITNDKQVRGLQVSAAQQRLAERIRDGEIDVSSVAPEAPDAALLASVLAALLGGSKSR